MHIKFMNVLNLELSDILNNIVVASLFYIKSYIYAYVCIYELALQVAFKGTVLPEN